MQDGTGFAVAVSIACEYGAITCKCPRVRPPTDPVRRCRRAGALCQLCHHPVENRPFLAHFVTPGPRQIAICGCGGYLGADRSIQLSYEGAWVCVFYCAVNCA